MPNSLQPDLFTPSLDGFKPLSGHGPRLWIRRLVIWRAPGEPKIQDIKLRCGLNIVWSPDADAEGGHIGHGGGKTSFCRLIRYCLGEESYGTDVQRQRIAAAMPDARVGAEIMLDGELWNVIRPIGAGAGTGRHCAQKGGSLEELLQGEMPNPTMRPLRHAIANAVMPSVAPHMPAGSSLDDAWDAALAWLTRDQECRLLDILDWRAPETHSRSPSRNMSKPDRLKVVRLLLKALQQDEIDATRRAQEHRQKAEDAARRRERIEWTRDEIGRDLGQTFGGDPKDDASLDLWASNADLAARAEEAKVDPEADRTLSEARELVRAKDGEIRQAELRLAAIDGELPGLTSMLRMMVDNLAAKDLLLQNANNPLCRTCGRPLDECDHEFIANRQAERDEEAGQKSELEQKQRDLLAEQDALKFQLAAASQELDRRKSALAVLERDNRVAAEKVASAKGYITLTNRYRSFAAEIGKLVDRI